MGNILEGSHSDKKEESESDYKEGSHSDKEEVSESDY